LRKKPSPALAVPKKNNYLNSFTSLKTTDPKKSYQLIKGKINDKRPKQKA